MPEMRNDLFSRIRRFALKTYLRIHEDYHHLIVYWLSRADYGGKHPKNHYTYRAGFFLERVRPDDRVLDIACGTGSILMRVSEKCAHALGIDESRESLAIARHQAGTRPNVELLELDIFSGDVPALIKDNGVTVGILSHILEHIERPVEYLRRLGLPRLLICVPSQENWYKQFLKSLSLRYLSDVTHFREYTHAMLREEIEAAGYQVIHMSFNSEGEIICEAILE